MLEHKYTSKIHILHYLKELPNMLGLALVKD